MAAAVAVAVGDADATRSVVSNVEVEDDTHKVSDRHVVAAAATAAGHVGGTENASKGDTTQPTGARDVDDGDVDTDEI